MTNIKDKMYAIATSENGDTQRVGDYYKILNQAPPKTWEQLLE